MEAGLDKIEVRNIFRRNLVGRVKISTEESSLMECIADAVAETIRDNNIRLLQQLKVPKNSTIETRV